MAQLKNSFRWSHSTQQMFERCKREFFLAKHQAWGGWDSRADDFTKLCYRLSKIQPLDMWAGSVVHDAIRGVLQRIHQGRTVEQITEVLEDEVINRLRVNWKQSLDEAAWLESPKWSTRLFEHHYGIEVPRERTDGIKANVLTCLGNFLESAALRQIVDADLSHWKSLEAFQNFKIGRFEVWLKMDFALELDGDELLILDWKTGKWRTEANAGQMMVYALYAVKEWGYQPERVHIRLMYLREEQKAADYCFGSSELEATEARIREQCLEIEEHLRIPEENEAHIDDFPMTEEQWKCRRCVFYEACYESREIELVTS